MNLKLQSQEVKKEYLKECRRFGVSNSLFINFKPQTKMDYILPTIIGVIFSLSVTTIEKNDVNYNKNLKESIRLMDIVLKN